MSEWENNDIENILTNKKVLNNLFKRKFKYGFNCLIDKYIWMNGTLRYKEKYKNLLEFKYLDNIGPYKLKQLFKPTKYLLYIAIILWPILFLSLCYLFKLNIFITFEKDGFTYNLIPIIIVTIVFAFILDAFIHNIMKKILTKHIKKMVENYEVENFKETI